MLLVLAATCFCSICGAHKTDDDKLNNLRWADFSKEFTTALPFRVSKSSNTDTIIRNATLITYGSF